MERTGVLLLQMGGPRSLDEVEPYIQRLFSDPCLVQLPFPVKLFRGPLSRRVARKRSPEVREQYEQIGGSSPNNRVTGEQAAALQEALGEDFRCYAAMTYTPPRIGEALARSIEDGCRRWVALSMFPQYSSASTEASFAELRSEIAKAGIEPKQVQWIQRWGNDAAYLDATAADVLTTVGEAKLQGPGQPHLLVTAHGIPVSYVKKGDPYVDEVESCLAGLRRRLPESLPITLAYQSRATPVKWVEPATIDMVAELGKQGERNLVMLPISFVNDHIETLYEIDIELKEVALENGIENYSRVPVFNVDPRLTALLRDLVLRETSEK
ncbi:MAG: ferrochelatase [Planctomycetota bacterium]|jgi:ferrochelatase|nr:ferrochelatase [Planctomycetota bacterium]